MKVRAPKMVQLVVVHPAWRVNRSQRSQAPGFGEGQVCRQVASLSRMGYPPNSRRDVLRTTPRQSPSRAARGPWRADTQVFERFSSERACIVYLQQVRSPGVLVRAAAMTALAAAGLADWELPAKLGARRSAPADAAGAVSCGVFMRLPDGLGGHARHRAAGGRPGKRHVLQPGPRRRRPPGQAHSRLSRRGAKTSAPRPTRTVSRLMFCFLAG